MCNCSCKETRVVNFVCHCRTQPEPIPEQPKKGYKPKPFTEIVRLQRPHITRQQPAQAPPDEKYVQQVLAEKAARRAAESARPKSATTERTQSASKSCLFSVCVYRVEVHRDPVVTGMSFFRLTPEIRLFLECECLKI